MGKVLGTILRAAAIAVGTVLGGPIGGAIAAVAVTVVSTLLAPGAPKPEAVTGALKTSRPPRVSGYGRSRLYGAYVLYESMPNAAGYGGDVAVDVYAVHAGEIDGIEAYYLADETVTVAGGVVAEGADGRYKNGAVRLYTTDGTSPGAGFPALESLMPGVWTSNHRGDGVVLAATTAVGVKAKAFAETYPSSAVPTVSLVARWQKCPDPSATDPLDESQWAWTENSVRQLLHYKLVREGPRPALDEDDAGYPDALAALRAAWWARKIEPTLQYWIDAAAVCDEPVDLAAGGTEPRYRSSVSHQHTDKHEGVVANFLTTFDGWICPRADGAYVIFAGKYYAPDPVADLVGPAQIVSYSWHGGAVDDDSAVNEMTCAYVSAEHDYNSVECDAWRDEADISRRGQVLSDPLDIMCPSHAQTRRIAKRKMQKILATDRGTVTTNIAGRHARGKRFIWLRIAEAGTTFYEGPAEITKLSRALHGGVTFDWVAANPDVDEWNPASEEGNPAALGDRVPPEALVAPAISGYSVTFDATGPRAELTIDAPERDDLTWFVHSRVLGAGVWGPDEQSTDADPSAAVALVTGYLPPDETVEIEVAYAIGDGRFSAWSATETVATDTSALAPDAPTDLSAADGVGSSVVTWRNPNSANFSYARVYRATSASFGAAAQIGADQPGGLGAVMTVTDTVAAGTYCYWVRAFSAADVASAVTGPDSAVVT